MTSKRTEKARTTSAGMQLSLESRAASSEDHELEFYARAAAEFKVTWQKHRREREKKFLRAAQAELDKHINDKRAELEGIVAKIEQAYQEYLLKTTATEDKMRAVMVAIIEKQKILLALSVQGHQKVIEIGQDLEESQVEALRQAKAACKDYAGLEERLLEF
ncbi:hypothetical protein SCLCIDRAFT_1098458 [Scleroderma citrinum Foug A]|uniref:Uncharacterized protein n=1 Tax=Scleroderma citrinum Foug A TaxID=1036808 RepID=A0A0C3DQB3_9AGAM|nr:hypothetical protein SCLCIDRAFT_1098458 [Scleroderma citrinum Foug A]